MQWTREREEIKQIYVEHCHLFADYDGLIPPGSQASQIVNMREIFGATEDDADRLRIVSLQEVSHFYLTNL